MWSVENFWGSVSSKKGKWNSECQFPLSCWSGPQVSLSQLPLPLFPGSGCRLLSVLFINQALIFLFTHLSSRRGFRGAPQSKQPPGCAWIRPSQPHLASVYRVESPAPEACAICSQGERTFSQVGWGQSATWACVLSGASSDVLELACKRWLLASLARPMFKCLHIGRNWPWKECVCHRNWQVPHIRAFASLQPPPPVPSSEEPAYTGDLYLSKASSSLVLGRPILTKEETVPLSGSSQPDDSPPCLLEYFMVLNSVVHIIYLILTAISSGKHRYQRDHLKTEIRWFHCLA